jgi:hypothetical protein
VAGTTGSAAEGGRRRDDTPDDARAATERDRLAREGRYLHECLFGRPIPEHVLARYVDAHDHLDFARDVDLERIVTRRLDPEALEYCLRRRSPRNALTQKVRTLSYLLEIERDYYGVFVRDRGTLWSALPAFVIAPVRSIWKLAKGHLQLRMHRVA